MVTSQAVQAFYEKHQLQEFADIHPLMFHVHAPGLFHMKGEPIRTLEDQLNAFLAQPRPVATLTTGFGFLALLLSGIGVYGVTAFAAGVIRRGEREVPVRQALESSVVPWPASP